MLNIQTLTFIVNFSKAKDPIQCYTILQKPTFAIELLCDQGVNLYIALRKQEVTIYNRDYKLQKILISWLDMQHSGNSDH